MKAAKIDSDAFQAEFKPRPNRSRETEGPGVSTNSTEKTPTLARHIKEIMAARSAVKWLLPNVLECGAIAVMAGKRSTYKSAIALYWALEVASNGRCVYMVS